MLEMQFRGWFQCRLATDPDPYDEPRGVSGYVNAYAGEPDLDRRIYFQSPPFVRSHGPQVGVTIYQVRKENNEIKDHPLLGATVDLLDSPVFEGRNGVIAEDGFEPIYPFHLQILKGGLKLGRAVSPLDVSFPYKDLLAKGVEPAPTEIGEITGLPDGLSAVWASRLSLLEEETKFAEEPKLTGLLERIEFLKRSLTNPPGLMGFFFVRMRYSYPLASSVTLIDPDGLLAGVNHEMPWKAEFWLGGWDADVLCGYCFGTLSLPYSNDPPLSFRKKSLRRP